VTKPEETCPSLYTGQKLHSKTIDKHNNIGK
jgi:hypothetical protein